MERRPPAHPEPDRAHRKEGEGKGPSFTRRQFLKRLGASAVVAGAAGAGIVQRAAEQKEEEARRTALSLEEGKIEGKEGHLSREQLIDIISQALGEYLEKLPLAHIGNEARWRTPPTKEDVERIVDRFATIVRVEGAFGDVVERGVEKIAEEVVEYTGVNPLGITTFGPAEIHPHTALRLAREHPWIVEQLVRKGLLPEEARTLVNRGSEEEPSPETIAHLLRLFDAVGAAVWGGLYFARLATIYGRTADGGYQLHNARAFSLAWSAYSAREVTPAVSALQNVVNEVLYFLDPQWAAGGHVLEVDGAWGDNTRKAITTLQEKVEALRSNQAPTGFPEDVVAVIRRGAPALLRAIQRLRGALEHEEKWGAGAPLEAGRAAWEIQHQSAAIRKALWNWHVGSLVKHSASMASVAPSLTPLVLQRYSTMMESYEALDKVIEEHAQELGDHEKGGREKGDHKKDEQKGREKAEKARNHITQMFREFVESSSGTTKPWFLALMGRPYFIEVMQAHVGGRAEVWGTIWEAWWRRLVERIPRRWESDGRWLGTIPTFRTGGLLEVDRNIPARLLLAWELEASPYAIKE